MAAQLPAGLFEAVHCGEDHEHAEKIFSRGFHWSVVSWRAGSQEASIDRLFASAVRQLDLSSEVKNEEEVNEHKLECSRTRESCIVPLALLADCIRRLCIVVRQLHSTIIPLNKRDHGVCLS